MRTGFLVASLLVLVALGASFVGLVGHELIHWGGVEEPLRLCVGVDGNAVGAVYFHGEQFWFGSEGVAMLGQGLLAIGLSLFGFWCVKEVLERS